MLGLVVFLGWSIFGVLEVIFFVRMLARYSTDLNMLIQCRLKILVTTFT